MIRLLISFYLTICLFFALINTNINAEQHPGKPHLISVTDTSFNFGVPKIIHVEKTVEKVLLRNITIMKRIDIVIKQRRNTLNITLENIHGSGNIRIYGNRFDNLILRNLDFTSLTIEVNEVGKIYHEQGIIKLANLNIKIDSGHQIFLTAPLLLGEAEVVINGNLDNLDIHGFSGERLTVSGSEQILSKVNRCHISLSNYDNRYLNSRIWIRNFFTNSIEIGTAPVISESIKPTAYYDIDIEHIVVGRDGIIINPEHIKLRSVEVRDIQHRNIFSSLHIKTKKMDSRSDLLVTGIRGAHNVTIYWESEFNSLTLRNIETVDMELYWPDKSITINTEINLGALNILNSIDAPKRLLLAIAANNNPRRPYDTIGFYKLIEKKGYYKAQDGIIERPGLEALKNAQLVEIRQRNSFAIIVGYLLYFVTGLGTDLSFPLLTWLTIILTATIIIQRRISKNPEENIKLDGLKLFFKSFVFLLFSAFSLGSVSNYQLKTIFSGVNLSEKLEKSVLIISSLVGYFTFLQITLCSIYYSQTTLR